MVETQRVRLTIVGASCATCLIPIRRALEKTEGVKSIGANYVADLILVDFDPQLVKIPKIVSIIKDSGYDAVPMIQ